MTFYDGAGLIGQLLLAQEIHLAACHSRTLYVTARRIQSLCGNPSTTVFTDPGVTLESVSGWGYLWQSLCQ